MLASLTTSQLTPRRLTTNIGRDERCWLMGFIGVVWLLTTLPYLMGFFQQGPDWRFSGFIFGVEDGNTYIGKMLRGADGDWLFRTPYTAYPQRGFLAFLPYLLLGKLTSAPGQHEQLVALFQFFRLAGAALFVLATYDFLSVFFQSIPIRRMGVFLATFGGGLGWLIFAGLGGLFHENLPLEFYSPETFGWLEVFGLPHLAVARALLLWGLTWLLRGSTPGWKIGLLWLLMGLFQPLTVVTGWAVMGMFLLVRLIAGLVGNQREQLFDRIGWLGDVRRVLVVGLVSSPIPIYTYLSFTFDSYLQGWAGQNLILSPPPLDYLLAFGWLLPFALAGLWIVFRLKETKYYLLAGWIILFPFLAYFPYPLQRRLPEGIWVALVCLALLAASAIRQAKSQRLAYGFLSLSVLTTLMVWLGANLTVTQKVEPIFIPIERERAFQALAAEPTKDAVVLAGYGESNALPAWTPVFTLIGHGPESMRLAEVQPRVERFFQAETSSKERTDLLREFHVDYILWGPEEQGPGAFDPNSLGFERIYDQGEYAIFQVSNRADP